MSLRELCDVSYMHLLEQADRLSTGVLILSVLSGQEFIDPRSRVDEWLTSEPQSTRDAALRQALGIR